MSDTQFSAQASCEVAEGFNLDSFLDGLKKRCVWEDNFIADNYGVIDEELCDLDFRDYVKQEGRQIRIHLHSEEEEYGDSEVFEWLTQQFIPVMTSRYLRVDSVKVDSRYGHSCYITFTNKNGDQSRTLSVDDLLAHYEAYGELTKTV